MTAAPAALRQRVKEYANSFAPPGAELPAMMRLKLEHTLRVADDCRRLARGTGLAPEDIRAAESAGLLHDIGRFEQYRRFGTFSDVHSVDHGELGAEILAGTPPLLEAVPDDDQPIVLHCVRRHNAKAFDPGPPPRTGPVLRVLRDADKVDIMAAVVQVIGERLHDEMPEILQHVDPDGPLSEELIREAVETGTVSYRHIRSLVDMALVGLVWTFDFSSDAALAIARDRGIVQALEDLLPKGDPRVRDLVGAVAERLARLPRGRP